MSTNKESVIMFIIASLAATLLFSGVVTLINQRYVAYREGIKKGKVEGCRELMVHLSDTIKPVDLHKALRYCNVTLVKEKK